MKAVIRNNKIRKTIWLLICGLALLPFIFGGCRDKRVETPASKPDKETQEVKVKPDSPETVREIQISENYFYNPVGKPDPFKPFISEDKLKVSGGSPLQNLEVSQLTLVGVISDSKEPLAMVEDAAGKGYLLRLGTRVGTQEGVVTSILEDKVIITEKVKDFTGKIKERPVALELIALGEGEY